MVALINLYLKNQLAFLFTVSRIVEPTINWSV